MSRLHKINKKGQDLSISTIIIAAIAVVVLVVIVAILTGRLGMFTTTLGTEGDSAKRTDSILNQCIADDKFYAGIDAAADAEKKTEAITKKDLELSKCKAFRTPTQCGGDCQWVG